MHSHMLYIGADIFRIAPNWFARTYLVYVLANKKGALQSAPMSFWEGVNRGVW